METATAKCPTCRSEFPAGATFCPTCGYIVPLSSLPAVHPALETAPPAPQSNVVYVQPPTVERREANWGPWVAIAAVVLLLGGGFALWSGGYLGGTSSAAVPASSVTIDNSPQMTSQAPPAPAPNSLPAVAKQPALPVSRTPAIDIISVKGQALETNVSQWKYGYTLRVRNNTAADVKTSFRIQFLDAQGFAVDDDVMDNLVIPAKMELSFDGVDMIKTPLAEKIRTIRAEVR